MKVKCFRLVCVILVMTVSANLAADSFHNRYFRALFSYRFQRADSLLHMAKPYLSKEEQLLSEAFGMLIRYEAGNADSEANYEGCMGLSEQAVELLKSKPMSDRQVFYYITGLGMLIKLKMDKERYVSVAADMYGLVSVIDYVTERENKNIQFRIISGAYYYYAALAKEEYPVMRAVLFLLPEGNKTHGLELLESCTGSSSVFISAYAYYTLGRIYHRDEKKFVRSNFFFNELLKHYPENCAWRREYQMMLRCFGETKMAEEEAEKLRFFGCEG